MRPFDLLFGACSKRVSKRNVFKFSASVVMRTICHKMMSKSFCKV